MVPHNEGLCLLKIYVMCKYVCMYTCIYVSMCVYVHMCVTVLYEHLASACAGGV